MWGLGMRLGVHMSGQVRGVDYNVRWNPLSNGDTNSRTRYMRHEWTSKYIQASSRGEMHSDVGVC